MPGRIEALDQELKKLKEIVLRLAPLAQQEMLNYRTLETQHSQLFERNNELAHKNQEAEEGIRKAITNAELIVSQANAEAQAIKANMNTLYVKVQSKFKDLERQMDEADRRIIRKNLKELEEVAA